MDGPFGLAEGWDPAQILTAINEALRTGVCITDKAGNLVSVSNGWCAIYGTTPKEVLGRPFTVVVPPEAREAAVRMHAEFLESGGEVPAEWEVRRLDGKPVWVRVGAARFFDRNGDPFKVTTVEDITARKMAERAAAESHARLEQLNRDKDRLFSIIGHDLRGPFSPILGYADLMENLGTSLTVDQALGYAHNIQEAAGHALALLDNLLDWARLHVEARPVVPTEQALLPVIDDAVHNLAAVAERKRIEVVVMADATVTLRVDAYMLTTALRNLLSNALKFTPEGGRVSVTVEQEAEVVRLNVIDTGVGVRAEVLRRIMEAGDPVSTLGTQNEPGTGLGLLVCTEMIQRLGGRIEADSQPGHGARFTLVLPRSGQPIGPDEVAA
ncbi:PAS domain S-box protein [Roseospira marina]|uniref:histidine kinase n=1 Tax=Roseospira marina TaxID=140057 RepID=A0A5M6I9H3_9PROT|nr:PAS domain-containing sensor histidine kinase [Roseospira marina]KAA5604880.1 PAS domain S-box protein [Roseospira marina]MBB4315217.1 PAS domain S-box-containing protein [Roseospira marina]MBB5088217.1 PAS domain S-box-containing protein [Roseospira marina]